ncbi:hypothetical protein [Phaeovulum sp. W22_SRMD_FR3]|uniref:hypothetical protein n=1 Tax=Phaeovulum sp. W22_SRMD_FR3 TaxID=3240274 RepID=UPI003F9ADAAC
MDKKLGSVAKLRELLLGMENELGLGELTRNELDLLYAIERLAQVAVPVRSEDMRQHPLVSHMTQPTFHRTLRGLLERGLLMRAADAKTGRYMLAQAVSHAS